MNQILKWSKDLPDSWTFKPLKSVANYFVSNVDKVPKDEEIPVLLCNYTDVYKNEFITNNLDFMNSTATVEEINKFKLLENDVIITKDSESWDDIGIPSLVIETNDKLVCGYHLAILRAYKNILYGPFLFRCLQSKTIRIQLELASTGVTRYGLPKDEIGRLYLPIPPFIAQKKISEFLDKETKYIDTLISAKERLLNLLIEKRHAIINDCISKGLNTNIQKKKDSELYFINEIPKHWIVLQLKFLSIIPLQYGANEAALDDNPSNPRFVRITDIDENGNLRDATFKSLEYEVAKPFLLEDGDVLFASGATVGKSFVYKDSWGVACFAGYLIRFRCDKSKLLPEYLNYFTQSGIYWTQINEGMIQATIQNFNGDKYGSMKFPLPPISDQKEIIAYLNNETERIEILKKSTKKSIELLKMRRYSIITEAVTGKIII